MVGQREGRRRVVLARELGPIFGGVSFSRLFDLANDVGAPGEEQFEVHGIPGLEAVEDGGVFDVEVHGHGGHEAGDVLVGDDHLPVFRTK